MSTSGGPAGLAADELETIRQGLLILALHRLHDPEAAEEVAQECLARALAALRQGRGPAPGKLGAFVAGIARHVIADVHRSGKRAISLDDGLAPPPPDAQPDPLTLLVRIEERAAVRTALATLSERDRAILRLCFYEGLTPAECAERLREPATRLRQRKSRALERLRRAFLGAAGHGRAAGATEKSEHHG